MGSRQGKRPADAAPTSEFAFLDDTGSPEPISRFEFLDEDDPADAALAEAYWTPLPLAPVVPATPWEAMDAEYRLPPGPEPALTVADFLNPHASAQVVARRARFEFPALVAWILLSCLSPNLVCWFTLGAGLIAFSYLMRLPFRLCGLRGQAGIYRALGIGQILSGLATVVDPGPFATFLPIYGLSVLLSWAFVEGRQLWLIERNESTRYSALYYS